MKKSGKVAIFILIIFLIVISIIACGYFIIKLDKKEKEMETIKDELTKLREDLGNQNVEEDKIEKNKEDNSIAIDSLNEEYSKKILEIKFAGSVEGIYFAIMGKDGNAKDFEELSKNSKIIYKNNYEYRLTNVNYSDYQNNVSFMTKSLFESLISRKYLCENAIINVDGKVAINSLTWTGTNWQYESQKLISKENNTYTYEIKYKLIYINETTEEYTATIIGKVENGKYIIEKFENK